MYGYTPMAYQVMPQNMAQPMPQPMMQPAMPSSSNSNNNQQQQHGQRGRGRGHGRGRGRGGNFRNSQKLDRSTDQNEAKNQKKTKNNQTSALNLNDKSISKLAQALKNTEQKDQVQKRPSNFLIGSFDGILEKHEDLKKFVSIFKSKVNTKLNFIPCNNINLNLFKLPEDTQVNHLILSFDPNWFDDIAKTNQPIQGSDNNGKLATYQIFDAVYERLYTQINAVKGHYRPKGVVFVVLKSGTPTDSVVAALAAQLGLTIIQIGNFGKKPVDKNFGPEELATRIADLVKMYKFPENTGFGGDLSLSDQNQIIDCDNL